jgi:starch phosphorylase
VEYCKSNQRLRDVLDLIAGSTLCLNQPGLFSPLVHSLLDQGDPYMLLADFDAYVKCQERVSASYEDQEAWTRMSILNVARMGRFSSDRTIREYAREIWNATPAPVRIAAPKP